MGVDHCFTPSFHKETEIILKDCSSAKTWQCSHDCIPEVEQTPRKFKKQAKPLRDISAWKPGLTTSSRAMTNSSILQVFQICCNTLKDLQALYYGPDSANLYA